MATAAANDGGSDRLLRVAEVMRRLSISRSALYALLNSGRIRSVRMPGSGTRFHRRIPESAVTEFVQRNTIGGEETK